MCKIFKRGSAKSEPLPTGTSPEPEPDLDLPESVEVPMPTPVILNKPLPNFYKGWTRQPWMVVLHYTASHNAEKTHEILEKRKLSVHATIERNGDIWREVVDENRAIHAGDGSWGGNANTNHHAFGIEIVNFGYVDGLHDGTGTVWDPAKKGVEEYEKDPQGRVWHRTETWGEKESATKVKVLTRTACEKPVDHRAGYSKKLWPTYPEKQLDSVLWLVWQWVKKHNILPENVVGHEHVSPARKADPGPSFPWDKVSSFLEERCAAELPELLDAGYNRRERVRIVQSHCARMGIDVGDIDGWWGKTTAGAVEEALKKFGEVYGFSHLNPSEDQVIELARAFRRVPGFDPGRH